MLQNTHAVRAEAGPTLSKAVVRAAGILGFNQTVLATLLGISRATASRLVANDYVLDPKRKKEWELALLFVRVFRSLEMILGHGEQARRWLEGENRALNGRPKDLILTTEGLVRVLHYLDASRARI